jgi:indole-3-glycerol phosphate synthase
MNLHQTVLQRIAADVVRCLEQRKGQVPEGVLQERRAQQPLRAKNDFRGALRGTQPRIIAEVKYASPSEGKLASVERMAPAEVARQYLENGAAALSVLTETTNFQGHLDYLSAIRAENPRACLLMKDFVVDRYQLLEGLLSGADAALLIVSLLGRDKTSKLLQECEQLGLNALVEVHDEAEMKIALQLGAKLIGVNNRDLKTLKISLDVSRRLARLANDDVTLVSESGLSLPGEILELHDLGFSAFLIGSSFMRTGAPGTAIAQLMKGLR